ncbi:MAG: Ger(x)C family spore germination protein [Clostridium sp.]|nr:Ger(x)C family spore germination protein [Clostridium sp.]
MKCNFKILKKFSFIIFTVLISSSILTGCYEISEIENVGMILAMGFDLSKDNYYKVSVQIYNSDSELNNNAKTSQVFSSEGETIFEAINNLNRIEGKKFNYSHIQYIVIGENLARKGINTSIDFTLRFNEMRPDIPIFISKTNAEDILSLKTSTDSISAFSVNQLINTERKSGYTVFTTNLDYIKSSNYGAENTVFGVIDIHKSYESKEKGTYELTGSAVFRKDKLVDYLSPKETRGLNWIKGGITSSNISVNYPSYNKISVEIIKSSSKNIVSIDNNKITSTIDLNVKSNIMGMIGDIDINANPYLIEIIQNREDEEICKEALMVVTKAKKKFGLDIFGVGDIVYRKYPRRWKTIKNKWNKDFANIEININAHSTIFETGTISKLN